MVKSVVKAMDAIQEFAKKQWNHEVKDFIISGASKRGWTSWLTGASDPRVKAIIPMVIDTLNMKPQMEHQVACYGKPSEMVKDYVQRGLIPAPKTPEARRLWEMVDPYFYIDKLTMPKLIINGANDPYWTVDALNLYWNDLKGEKYVVIVPNAGHNLQETGEDGKVADLMKSMSRVINASSAFTKHQLSGAPLPKLTWTHDAAPDGRLRLTIQSSKQVKGARLWVANSDSADFRKSRWKEQPAETTEGGKTVVGTVAPPAQGRLAYYGEVDFEIDGTPYTLCTQVRVAK
jgi:PhoPQ-activated pathogenicity-related protein